MVEESRYGRRLVWLVAVAVAAGALDACGGKSDEPSHASGGSAGKGATGGTAGNAGSAPSGAGGTGGEGDSGGAGGEPTGGCERVDGGFCDGCRPTGVYAGARTSCVLREDGSISCWGADSVSLENEYRVEGVASPPAGSYRSLSMGTAHGCALTDDGVLVCWGNGREYDFDTGDGPSEIPTGGPFVRVSAGYYASCVIDTERRATCWGPEWSLITAPESEFLEIAAGERFACGIDTLGLVTCWGRYAPAATPPDEFQAISAGGRQVCGIRVDGTLACWGETAGDVPDGSFEALAVGDQHACAIGSDQSVTCWGAPEGGRLAAPAGSFVQLSAGSNHTCATRASGGVTCWGLDSAFQSSPPPAISLEDDCFVHFSAGGDAVHDGESGLTRACGLRVDGSIQCFGAGAGEVTGSSGNERFVQVSAGYDSTCALTTSGELSCWGALAGQAPTGQFVQVSTGFGSACAVRTNGALSCWGELPAPPIGTFTQVSVSGDSVPRDETGGGAPQHACALRTNQSAICWGDTWLGHNSPWPSNGAFDGPLVQVAAGYRTDCALRPDGGVVCHSTTNLTTEGYASIGNGVSLGGLRADGTAVWPDSSAGATERGTFTEFAVAGDYACGLRADGNVSCFGSRVR